MGEIPHPLTILPKMITSRQSALVLVSGVVLGLALTGCEVEPKAIRYGRDECAECRMTLVDQNYGAELITTKGKVHIFDDLNCLVAFHRREAERSGSGSRLLVVPFGKPNTLLPAASAHFLQHDGLRSPMASGTAAFSTLAELENVLRQLGGGGRVLRWSEVVESF